MLGNGMLESNLLEIPLLSIPSQVMLSVIEFLYTGNICLYPIQGWREGFETIKAAKFFMIPTIELIAQDHILREASKCDLWVTMGRFLSLAVEFQEDWKGKGKMLQELAFPIALHWGQLPHELSRNVVSYIMCNRRVDHGGKRSTEKYNALKSIVLWHVGRVTKGRMPRRLVNKILPFKEALWVRMFKMPDIDGFISDTSASLSLNVTHSTAVLNSCVGARIHKRSLDQMLQQYVNLSYIPASLLVTVIPLLKLFSPEQLLNALVCGAFCMSIQQPIIDHDELGNSSNTIRFEHNGRITFQSEDKLETEMVFPKVPESKSSDTYDWNFKVLDYHIMMEIQLT